LHYLYPDQTEQVEEIDLNSNEVLSITNIYNISQIVRKWKRPKEFGQGSWEYEIGEPPKSFNPESDLLAPSGDNVKFWNSRTLCLAYFHKKRHW
jgi:hypothetical protein